ncbi:MAG: ABC transporter ATPase [Bacteroidia bacterium]
MEKVWIYQSNRNLTPTEVENIKQAGEEFVEKWAAHKMLLTAGFDVLYNRFLVIKVDESLVSASGCSIDESVRFVKALESKFGLNLFDRMQMAYLADSEKIESATLQEISNLYKSGKLKDNTLVFNNLVQDSKQMNQSWKIPFAQSGFVNFK